MTTTSRAVSIPVPLYFDESIIIFQNSGLSAELNNRNSYVSDQTVVLVVWFQLSV